MTVESTHPTRKKRQTSGAPVTFFPRKRRRDADDASVALVRQLLGNRSRRRDLLIEHLHLLQDFVGYLDIKHLHALAAEMKISAAEIHEVATFYHHFDVVREGEKAPPPLTVRVCDSVTCSMAGADKLVTALEQSLQDNIRVQRVPCVGRCAEAPVVVVGTHPVPQAEAAGVIECIENGETEDEPKSGWVDYTNYCNSGGYTTLQRCLDGKLAIDDIIGCLKDSALRGLGGAGFPVGTKWEIVSKQAAPRLMAVNIDEGEPGTFKDRHYLERNPHQFFEGMLIAAHTVGIGAIYIYLRDEYAGVRKLLTQELQVLQRNRQNLPEIQLRRGAGAYICGEESAMIESLEGKRGMPRLRPPFVAEVGLFGQPTLEHNMESLYWVRPLLEKGADWFKQYGRHGRTGLRSFSVSGRVVAPGVHLAPAGITVRELIDEYCGGMLPGHTLYGYFPGGASGGILPASMDDIPLDFDTLNSHGCFIGSAAVIVFSDKDSARELAQNAMQFFEHESCGQCTPCRVGTAKAAILMKKRDWDQELLKELADVMQDASICGLGQAAPNPLQCIMKYFPEELGNGNGS